jgi:predicted nucleic acid-binding protein
VVIGELACGNLARRREVLDALAALPRTAAASDDEVLALIEGRRLHGRGLGWVDAHLLASALLSRCDLWTRDAALAAASRAAGVRS